MHAEPATIGPYRVQQRLGAGGMGCVYLAHDTALQRLVALKVLNQGVENEGVRERFTREAHYAARLRHPNIITIFGFGHDDRERPFIVMEYLPGETLADLIARRAPLTLTAKLSVMRDVCAGLGHAHKQGLLHRDIKPANVMVDVDGTAKIVDFGIARHVESDLTQTGAVIGTLNYLSPEQLRGETLDRRSDIFAVGTLFYELLTGSKAFPGGIDEGVLGRIMTAEPVPIRTRCSDVPAEIEACVARALSKQPTDRYTDLAAMSAEIARIELEVVRSSNPKETNNLAALIVRPQIEFDPYEATTVDTSEQARLVHAQIAEAEKALRERRFRQALTLAERALAIDASAADALTVVEEARAALRAHATVAGSSIAVARRPRRFAVSLAAAAVLTLASVASWLWYRSALDNPPPPAATSARDPFPGPVQALTTSVPAPGPDSNPMDRGAPMASNIESLLEQARSLYQRGQREQALGVVQSALLIDAGNAAAGSLVENWLAAARANVRSARSSADALETTVRARREYLDGQASDANANRAASSRPTDALRLFWQATASYNAAIAAVEAAAATATPSMPAAQPPAAAQLSAPATTTIPVVIDPPGVAPAPTTTVAAQAPRAPQLAVTPTPAPAASAPASETPVSTIVTMPAGATLALERYAAAYSRQSLADVKAIFPSLPKDREDSLKRAFNGACRSYEVRFGRLDPSRVTADSVYVIADSTYVCTPRTGGARQTVTAQDVFQLRRSGASWIIASMQLM